MQPGEIRMYPSTATALLAFFLAAPAMAQQASDVVVPEPETQVTQDFAGISDAAASALAAKRDGRPTDAEDWMVAAAHPLAVDAGARVLREGGSAADAMVAVVVVTLTPASHGVFKRGRVRPSRQSKSFSRPLPSCEG